MSAEASTSLFKRGLDALKSMRYPLFLCLTAVVAFVAVIYFFSPRFSIWKGLGLGTPLSYSNPECNRALFTQKKIENPYQFYEYPPTQNADANWRLLFPLLGHYLHISGVPFFALPFIGCLLVLAFVAHLVCQRTGDRWLALGVATLMGSTSWFFVSTGWLAYFDSWYVLGLLLVGFAPSRWALASACFLTPWVDERFAVVLPVAMVVRGVYFNRFEERPWTNNWRDLLVIIGTMLPWVAFRVFIMVEGTDSYTVTHHFTRYNYLRDVQLRYLIESHWVGFRAVWIFVVCFLWLAMPVEKRWWTLPLLGVILATQIPLAALSGDWSRDVSSMLPVAILGVLLLQRYKRAWAYNCVFAALAFNLLAPAHHGFDKWRLPIANLYTEIERYKNPPDYLNPLAYNQLAIQLADRGDYANALTNLNHAVYLNAKNPDVLFNRGFVRWQLGDRNGAVEDLSKAIKIAPDNWVQHSQAKQLLDNISSQPR
jgi:hypothetical protein